jgi:hypothetical protein
MQPGIGNDLLEIYDRFKTSKAAAQLAGREEQQRNRLLEIGQIAGKGDYSGAASKALAYGDFNTGNNLLQIAQGKKKQEREDEATRLDRITRTLFAANTPETYARAIQSLEASGEQFDPHEKDWNYRDTLIAEGMSIADQLKMKGEGYTLGEGQVRFDANGNQIAAGPPKSSSTAGFTLGEGQTRYGPNGEVLAAGPPKTVQPRALTSVDKQAILEADDQVQAATNVIDMLNRALAINDKAGSGALAGTQAFVARNDPTGFFDDEKGAATTEFNNIVLNQALASMKSIFGGNPTEGERAVLVQLQGAADKSPVERKAIIERGIELAKRRLAFNKERAEEIRGGSYFGGASTVQPSGQQQGGNESETIFGEAGEIPEGAIVEDEQGNRYQKNNGTLEAIQ